MGAHQHPTTEPEQQKTDRFAVFRSAPGAPNLQLIARPEVPRYTVPTEDGVRADFDKRVSMAVTFAVTDQATTPVPQDAEGEEFLVMYDMEKPMEFVEFERNPAMAGVWNPNEETASEFREGYL